MIDPFEMFWDFITFVADLYKELISRGFLFSTLLAMLPVIIFLFFWVYSDGMLLVIAFLVLN